MTFKNWLLEQSGRDDRIGDVAQDFTSQSCCRQLKGGYRRLSLHILVKHDACFEAQKALKEAVHEFKKANLKQ